METVRFPMLVHCTLLLLYSAALCSAYVQFEPVLVPKSAEAKLKIRSTTKVTYGTFTREAFRKIARTTEDHNCLLPGCQRMGEVLDFARNNVSNFDRDTFGTAENRSKVDFSHYPSGGVLIQEEDIGRWFMLYQFEKPNPGTVYRMRMRLENDTALASRLNVPLNFAPVGGLWKPRSAIVTPRGTMIGTEGIPPDGKLYEVATCMLNEKRINCLANWDREGFIDIIEFMRYFRREPAQLKKEGKLKLPPKDGIPGFKPYRYGFPYEVSLGLNEDDRVIDKISKLYALGRTGAHGIAVMQDGFTVYISGGKGGLFRFVADPSVKDFSRGELFAAVFRLKGDAVFTEIGVNTRFTINWVSLGTTNVDDVAQFVSPNTLLTFSDMFRHSEAEGGVCEKNFKLVTLAGVDECLQLVDSRLAAVFEPERLAAVFEATVGVFQFSEMATRLDSDRFYLGGREIVGGNIEVDSKTNSGEAPIATIAENRCGCVFEVSVSEDFTATTMRAISCGSSTNGIDNENACSTEGIANPRSLTYVNIFEYLLIGEDSDKHANNYVWAWDPETGRSTRIFHAAAKGGITSLTWFQDVVGGNNYIGTTISKPLDTFGWLSYFGSFDLTSGQKMTFSGVPVPYARGPKRLPIAFRRVTIGESERFGRFKALFSTGTSIPLTGEKSEVYLGLVVDRNYQAVKSYKDGPVRPIVVNQDEIHHKFGFVSIIDMCGSLFSISSLDSIPGVSYLMKLTKTRKGVLKTVSTRFIDWSKWGGLWRTGDGVVSPWNTHIGGEIFEPDSLDFTSFPCLTGFSSCFKSRAESAFVDSMKFIRYFGRYFSDLDNKFEKLAEVFNPYNYGYAFEIEVNKYGCSQAAKLMTLGRFSHGDITIMPDRKTVYMVDTTTGREIGGGLFKFIARRENDLTSGTLYAAKMKPVFGTLEKFTVSWVKLGTATNSELAKRVKSIKFSDVFNFIPAAKNCRLRTINVKSQTECIDVKPSAEKWAAFFETRRFAALRGATIEFGNVKGLTFDQNTNKLFMSITRISKRDKIMLQDDVEGSSNDIKVSSAACGVLFEMSTVETADSEFDIKTFQKAYKGTNLFGTFGTNMCSVEDPANPGSMSSIPGHNQFLVAEDSCDLRGSSREVICGHENNALWTLDPFLPRGRRGEEREKTRILTVPPKSSLQSVTWYPRVGGVSLLTAGINELYHEGFDRIVESRDAAAVFGYLGPFVSQEADNRRPEVKAVKPVCKSDKPRRGSGFICPKNFKFN